MMDSATFAIQTVLNACDTVEPDIVVEIARRELPHALRQLARDDADDVFVGVTFEG
jgi:hypothetical protein